MVSDADRFAAASRASRENPKYKPGHRRHTADCMSEWAENARGIMTPETIVENHRLHMGDVPNADDKPGGKNNPCEICGTTTHRHSEEECYK